MSILVATDFSPAALDASNVAAQLAYALHEPLKLVHVLEPGTAFPLDDSEQPSDLAASRREVGRSLLAAACESLAIVGLDTEVDLLVGELGVALAFEIETHQHTLLVVGGCTARYEASYRGVAEEMPCAVLVVRPISDRLRLALTNGRRIRVFVVTDRAESSNALIEWLRWLRKRLSCDITVTQLYSPAIEHQRLGITLADKAYAPDGQMLALLETELRGCFSNLAGVGELVVHCEPRTGPVAGALLDSARVAGADLVVVGSQRKHRMARFLHRSVSRDVLRHSGLPVVCIDTRPTSRTQARAIRKLLVANRFFRMRQ